MIQVKKQITETELEVYSFNILDMTAVFVKYEKEFKPEGKRVWKSEVLWDKYYTRGNTLEKVDLPDDVRELALDEFKRLISVKTWDEFKNK